MNWTERPAANEYDGYYELYVSQVPEGDLLETLAGQRDDTLRLLRGLSEEQAAHRYAADKWSIKEVIGHVVDVERVFAFRSLHFARGDSAPLPSLEQDDWAAMARADARSMGHLADEFDHVRSANVQLFESYDQESALRRGIASNVEFTARAIAFIIAGHEIHHVGVIRDRYL